jgi:hypothetical protein
MRPQAPLSQTLQRVVASFDCLLDILQLQQRLAGADGGGGGGVGGGSGGDRSGSGSSGAAEDHVLLGIARELLAVGEGP